MSDQAHEAEPTGRRRYSSPKREAAARATRRRIRSSARSLFLNHGYAQTSVSAIAADADVAEKTVYLAFASKPDLLSDVIRVAVRGDDGATAIADRDDWQEILSAPTRELVIRLAHHEAAALERTARLLAMADIAVAGDPRLTALRDRGHASQRNLYAKAIAQLAQRKALALELDPSHAADTIFALTHEAVYLRLTDECGWTPERYAEWLGTTLTATLIRPDPHEHA
jgi:AcrR family transcriptional regulator